MHWFEVLIDPLQYHSTSTQKRNNIEVFETFVIVRTDLMSIKHRSMIPINVEDHMSLWCPASSILVNMSCKKAFKLSWIKIFRTNVLDMSSVWAWNSAKKSSKFDILLLVMEEIQFRAKNQNFGVNVHLQAFSTENFFSNLEKYSFRLYLALKNCKEQSYYTIGNWKWEENSNP